MGALAHTIPETPALPRALSFQGPPMMAKLLDKLRSAWRSFVAGFDYEPPLGLAPTQPADTEIMAPPPARPPVVSMSTAEPAYPPDVQAALDRIARAQAHELPPIVTMQARNDDGPPVIGRDGLPELVRQDGSPLTVIERAIMARAKALREAL